MVDQWIHLTMLPGDPWVLQIWNAVHQSEKGDAITDELRELALSISKRLNILPRIRKSLDERKADICCQVKDHGDEHVFSEGSEGYVFTVDNDLLYRTLADIDSLLFELNSLCELMTKFFEKLHELAGRELPEADAGRSIKKILEDSGNDGSWFVQLNNHRNLFIHNSAPYIAVDISNNYPDYDLLIMKEQVEEFSDPSKFITLSQLNEIVNGFEQAKDLLQRHLINLFNDSKKRLCG